MESTSDASQRTTSRASIEHRPSDFPGRGARPQYLSSTTCTCCCCLHWIGATVGGVTGMVYGWNSAHRAYRGALHPRAKAWVAAGAMLGLVVAAVALVLSSSIMGNRVLLIIALVPVLVFVPPGLGMMLGALISRSKMPRKVDDEGIYCLNCLYDLRGSLESGRCPECGQVFDPTDARRGLHFGARAAWRATWMGLVFSILGAAIGYLMMAGCLPKELFR